MQVQTRPNKLEVVFSIKWSVLKRALTSITNRNHIIFVFWCLRGAKNAMLTVSESGVSGSRAMSILHHGQCLRAICACFSCTQQRILDSIWQDEVDAALDSVKCQKVRTQWYEYCSFCRRCDKIPDIYFIRAGGWVDQNTLLKKWEKLFVDFTPFTVRENPACLVVNQFQYAW